MRKLKWPYAKNSLEEWYLAGVRINSLKHTLNCFVFHLRCFLSELKWPYANHVSTGGSFEPELNLSLRFGFSSNLPTQIHINNLRNKKNGWMRVRERVTLGSWMKLWPDLALGGNSPVQESFKHSMIVCEKMHVWESRIDELIEWEWNGTYRFASTVGTDD